MKKVFKKLSLILSFILVLTSVVGCSTSNKKEGDSVVKGANTIVDTYGRYVDIPESPEKIVVLNSGVYDLICALGAKEKIVGVTDTTKILPNDTQKEIVGTWKEPNVEKILEMKPDVVFGYKKYMSQESAKQIEEAGIALVYIDAYKVENMAQEISTLGLILGKQKESEEYLAFLNKYTKLIEERTADIEDKDKVSVYWEGYSDYTSVGKGTGGDGVINAAGGINIAGTEGVEYPKISDEWMIEKNPNVIVKVTSSSKAILGMKITDDSEAKVLYDSLVGRTGWNELDPVKNNKTYLLSNDIATTPQGSVIGSLYLASWLYPEKFEDINPADVHKEMLKTFYGLEEEGMWTYAPVN